MIPLVVLTRPLPPDWVEGLHAHAVVRVGDFENNLPRAHGVLSLLTETVDDAVLAAAPRLRVLSNMAVGVDNIDVEACTRRGIPVGNTPGVLTEATADLTMTLLLAAARRLPEALADARAGRWTTWSPTGWLGRELCGARLGIIGMGKIGRAVARRAHGFGLDVVYADHPSAAPPEAGTTAVPLAELLATSDFVSLHVPLTPATQGMIGADALRRMKPGAILINTARGPIVDLPALLHALGAGTLGGAALDVTDPEPLPAQDPAYREPKLIIAPHIGSATEQTRRRMAQLAVDNVVAGLQGRRLPHCVNPQVYRSSGLVDAGG